MSFACPSELRAELARLHAASFGWALSCCARNRHDAEELLQDVYLKVLDGKASFDRRAGFQTWLFAVIRRTAADQRRRRALRQLLHLRFAREPAWAESPDEAPDLQGMFKRALQALPARQREVLSLVFYH